MKKEYETLSVDVVKFEAQDVITVSAPDLSDPTEGSNNDQGPPKQESSVSAEL